MSQLTVRIVAAALLAAGLASQAEAADCTGTLSPSQILGCLAPAPMQPAVPMLKTRGIRAGVAAHRGVTVEGQETPPPAAEVNLAVSFEFNSAQLTNDGMIALDALGKALTDPALQASRFRLAGHTDAVGSDVYNQKLSEQRAGAVRAYLVSHFQLDPAKFEVVGFGRTQLFDPANPTSAANRRVQVTRL